MTSCCCCRRITLRGLRDGRRVVDCARRRAGRLCMGWVPQAVGGDVMRRAFLSIATRLRAFDDWLDDSLIGALLGGLTIFGWLIAFPVLLPLIFEVFQ